MIGRRTQTALWGKRLEDIRCDPDSLLILDSCGQLWDVVGAANLVGAVYKEYIIFRNGKRPVHIITSAKAKMDDEDTEMFSALLFKRCAFIDSKKHATFAAVDGDPLLRNPKYREICRAAKGAVENGRFIEESYSSLTNRDWMDSVDVFIADEYTHNAIFMAMTGHNEPCVMHIGSEKTDIYVPFSSIRPVCFIPNEKPVYEAICSVVVWLFDSGLVSPARRLITAMSKSDNPWNTASEFEKL